MGAYEETPEQVRGHFLDRAFVESPREDGGTLGSRDGFGGRELVASLHDAP